MCLGVDASAFIMIQINQSYCVKNHVCCNIIAVNATINLNFSKIVILQVMLKK